LVAAESTTPANPDAWPPPVEKFFGLPNLIEATLSPDGTKIAFLFPNEKRFALGIYDRATKESRMLLRGEDESFSSYFWKGNDRIVFAADVSGNESFLIGSTDLTGKHVLRNAESQRLENNLTGDFARIIDELPLDPEHIAVVGYFAGNIDNSVFVGGAMTIARVNVQNRAQSTLMEFRESDRGVSVFFDNRGALRLRSRLEGHTLVWEHRATDSDRFKVVARHPFHGYEETWDPKGFAADNRTLWLISREEQDRGALYAIDTRTFEKGAPVFVPPEGEITGLIATRDRSRLLGVQYESERIHHHWFDQERAALQAKLEATFTGCDVAIASLSDDENTALIVARHDREPGVYYVFDRREGSLTQFRRIRDLNPALLSPRRPIQYVARDGLVIHGYLTIPRGTSGKKLPLVMHPHGGPFGVREHWGYDRDCQFLASRGYAVLQPNYRGSGGYGRDFIDKGRYQWGRAMQDDLTDGVKWAIAEGIADPARIAIYGASYGGYASLAGVELTPGLYACGVNYVGAADLELTFHGRGEEAYTTDDDFSYRREWVGPTREYRDATSPINLVDRIKVPTLHAYGLQDPRVKIDHWSRLEPQLKKYHKDYKSIVEGKQGHGFHDQDASVSFYAALEKFLAEHLAPEGNVKVGRPEVIDMPAKK
jgi:dipeptidyl aminopeptidase/acylaminoacyl peptidase